MRGDYDDAPPVIKKLSFKQPVAKKDYKCAYCSDPIVEGTKHNKYVYVDDDGDGKIHTARYHIMCPWDKLEDEG